MPQGKKKGLVVKGQLTEQAKAIGLEAETESITVVAQRHGVSTGTVATLFKMTHDGLSKQSWRNITQGTQRNVGRKRMLFEEDGTLSQFGQDVLDFLKTHSFQRASREFGLDIAVMRRTLYWVTGQDIRAWRKQEVN